MRIYKTLPDLERSKHMGLWHKALSQCWSPDEIAWDRPLGFAKEGQRDHVARLLSPILIGEQAGLYSISSMIQLLGQTSEVESQMYLTTMAVDEARHTEVFSRFFGRIERTPMSIRRMPNGYLFQSAIISDDPLEWITGTLVSELSAIYMIGHLRERDLDPVLSEMCDRIRRDEARHVGFNHMFVEDRVYRQVLGQDGELHATADRLRAKLEAVLALVPPMLDDLDRDLAGVGIDRVEMFERLQEDCRKRLETAIESGLKKARHKAITAP